MRRNVLFNWILSFLLIGIGFVLGQFYASNDGFSQQGKTLAWAAPSLLTEAGGSSPLFMGSMLPDAPWKQELDEEILFPARIGTLHMDKLIAGPEALEHALRIHGEDAPLVNVFIPYYSGREEQVTVWIFEIHNSLEAVKHLKKINDRITGKHDPCNYGSFYLQDVQVFHLQVSNVNNYYYRKGDSIYWISLITNDPIPLFLRFYEQF